MRFLSLLCIAIAIATSLSMVSSSSSSSSSCPSTGSSMSIPAAVDRSPLLEAAASKASWLSGVRRRLHAVPELMYDLVETTAIVKEVLKEELEIAPSAKAFGKSGIAVRIGSGEPPFVGLRADMDALPIHEDSKGVAAAEGWASRNSGKMHACGHDAHTTMLLGAASLLKEYEVNGTLPGTVQLYFQPAEEGGHGARAMIQDGVLKEFPASAVFALHVWPDLPSGVVGTRGGPIMAATGSFSATIIGAGGHGAIPHNTIDPIVAMASVITSIQSIVARRVSPLDSAVISVTHVESGFTHNVIPDSAFIEGTVRALNTDSLFDLYDKIEQVITGVAAAHGCSANTTFLRDPYPALVNDDSAADFALDTVRQLFGSDASIVVPPTMTGEDFSYFAMAKPSAYIDIGIRNETAGAVFPLHSSQFVLDENVLPRGAALLASLALNYLDTNQEC